MKFRLIRTEQDFWNIIFMIFFATLVILFYVAFKPVAYKVSLMDIIILAFADYRFVRLITKDKIMKFLQNYFSKYRRGPFKTIYELIICPWCVGIWGAFIMLVLYVFSPITWFFVFIFAIAGLAGALQIWLEKSQV